MIGAWSQAFEVSRKSVKKSESPRIECNRHPPWEAQNSNPTFVPDRW